MAKPLKKQSASPDLRLASVRREIPQLDRLIHEKLRLGILSALAARGSMSFSELKKLLETSDGNLSVHSRKLEEAGYIRCEKSFAGRVPKTEFTLSSDGRKALERYLDHMEALVQAMRGNHE